MIIRVGRLWDGSGPDYRHDVDVIIEGNRIATIAPLVAGAIVAIRLPSMMTSTS